MSSGAEQKYQTMPLEEIKKLPIPLLVEKDAVLFLWGTVPLLPYAFQVMKSWGFEYKTMITWRKMCCKGLGYWFRGQTEHLLFGIRGKVPAFRSQRSNFLQHHVMDMRLKHSEKPAEFRSLIEYVTRRTFAEPKRIELFARHKIPNWDAWGLEVPEEMQPLELFNQ